MLTADEQSEPPVVSISCVPVSAEEQDEFANSLESWREA